MSPLLLLCLLHSSVAETQGTALQVFPQTWADLWPLLQIFTSQALEFLSGVTMGLQADIVFYSPCVLSYLAIAPQWTLFQQKTERVWQDGNLVGAFEVLQATDEFLTTVVSSGQRCQIWLLFQRLADIFTVSGFLYYALIVYLNQALIQVSVT